MNTGMNDTRPAWAVFGHCERIKVSLRGFEVGKHCVKCDNFIGHNSVLLGVNGGQEKLRIAPMVPLVGSTVL